MNPSRARAAWVAVLVALSIAQAPPAFGSAAGAVGRAHRSVTAQTWVPTQAPGPVADSTGYHLKAVDCWAPGNCVAVGYRSANGTVDSFIDEETDGAWSNVAATGEAVLTAVSCPEAGACVAVGGVGPGSDPEAVLEVQSGSTWTTISATGANGLYQSATGSLTGVACPVANSCTAVGQAQSNAEVSTGFLLTLEPGSDRTKAGSWAAQQAPEPAGDAAFEDAGLAGVSCVSAGNCRAVGFAHDDANFSNALPLVDEEKNYVWAYGGSPAPSGTVYGQLKSVSCVKGGSVCMAGGLYDYGRLPFVATLDTDTDSVQAAGEGLASPFSSGDLSATSCAADGQCQSVGVAYANSGSDYGYDGLVVSERYGTAAGTSAASASATESPGDANTTEHNETLDATSCVSGGFCVSVGSYLNNSGPQSQNEAAVIDTRTYDSSGAVVGETDIAAPEPANDTVNDDQSLLLGVSCSDSTHCSAVGSYFNDSDQSRGVIDTLGGSMTPAAAGSFGPAGPARVLDTRYGVGAKKAVVAAGQTVAVSVTGMNGVPATGVSAVVLNVTVTAPAGSGFVTAFADGSARPTASNLNFSKSETVPNLVVAPVGADGKVDLYTSAATQLIADVAGFYRSGTPTEAGTFGAVGPARVLDTRYGVGAPKAAVAGNHSITVKVTGAHGVPDGAVSAVVLNVTAAGPVGPGHVTAWGSGARPNASNLNFVKGEVVPNLVIVPVSAGGTVELFTSATTHLIADIAGYFTAGAPTVTGAYGPVTPTRLLDTRYGTGATRAPVAGGHTVTLAVDGRAGLPATGISAVVLNVTVVGPSGSGFVTAYPGGTRPTASNLNYRKGEVVPNLVIVPVSASGTITLYTSATTQLLADVAGYYRSDAT